LKKIVIITHGAHGGRGGIDKYVKNIIDVLSRDKNQYKINILSKNKINLKKKNINLDHSKKSYLLLILSNYFKIITSDLIIVTHINLTLYLFFLIFNRKKIVLFSYGLEIWGSKKSFLYKFFIKKIKYFICMRKFTLDKQKKIYKLNNNKYFLLNNPLDANCEQIINSKKDKIIITVARLDRTEKYKGIDETLEAISLIKKINFKYFIIGDGDDKKRLIQKAKKLKIDKFVYFKGHVNDKIRDRLFSKSKICSMPGTDITFDTYPYRFSFLEAAMHGLHIIASKPNHQELTEAKIYKNFNFIDSHNRKLISRKIIQLLNKKNIFCKKLRDDFSFRKFEINLIDNIKIILED